MHRLPPAFTSLYRLLLRASSASVLHQNVARRHLRQILRPVVEAAAQVVGDLQTNQLSHIERMKREHFLNIFEQRMDGTLDLLVNSAHYRGVPHRAIYNLNRLRKAHAIWIRGKYYSGPKKAWNPKAVVPNNPKPRASRDTDRIEKNRMHERCWDALGEVVRMAEGRHNLSLGRLHLKPWTLEWCR